MAPRRPIRTFLDAGVLIIAYGTQRPFQNVALELICWMSLTASS